MKKVLILQNTISSYRAPIYNIIARSVLLDVGYWLKDETEQYRCDFNKIKLAYKKWGPFIIMKKGFRRMLKDYDAIILVPDLHVLSYIRLPFVSRKCKVLTWGIGMRASYELQYDLTRKLMWLDKIFLLVQRHADACIFYMKQTKSFWRGAIPDEKIFIAPNTVAVEYEKITGIEKKDILFIGSLYKQKGVELLIKCFEDVVARGNSTNQILHIVGKGELMDELKTMVSGSNIDKCVIFHGPIYNEQELNILYNQSILCISPTQAGLSVPKSMGYATAFVTHRNAITGGEIYHIKDGETGLLFENEGELKAILLESTTNPQRFIEIGAAAREYYEKYASPSIMAKGVVNALNYCFKS